MGLNKRKMQSDVISDDDDVQMVTPSGQAGGLPFALNLADAVDWHEIDRAEVPPVSGFDKPWTKQIQRILESSVHEAEEKADSEFAQAVLPDFTFASHLGLSPALAQLLAPTIALHRMIPIPTKPVVLTAGRLNFLPITHKIGFEKNVLKKFHQFLLVPRLATPFELTVSKSWGPKLPDFHRTFAGTPLTGSADFSRSLIIWVRFFIPASPSDSFLFPLVIGPEFNFAQLIDWIAFKLATLKPDWAEEFSCFHLVHDYIDVQKAHSKRGCADPTWGWPHDRKSQKFFDSNRSASTSGYLGKFLNNIYFRKGEICFEKDK